MTLTISVQEYESVTLGLSYDDLGALQAAAGSALQFAPGPATGTWVVRARGSVGTIVAGRLRILIRPKVSAANLFHMLEADGNSLDVGAALFDYETTGDLLAAFSTFYCRVLERAVARGIPRVYVEEADDLTAIRGRINLRRQLVGGGLPLPIACEFDELSIDSQLLRIVAEASRRFSRMPAVSAETRQALRRVLVEFEGVGALSEFDLERPTPLNRLNQHFAGAEHLARIVLEGSSILDQSGGASAGSFLVNMATLFERFLESRMRRSLRGQLVVRGQFRTTLDHAGSVRMRPDLVFTDRRVAVYVADAKYKLTGDGFGRESDYYQLLAYCSALGLDEGLLIYCQHDGSVPAREVIARDSSSTRLRTAAVQLSGTPAELDARMAELSRWIVSRTARSDHPFSQAMPSRGKDRLLAL